MNKELCDEITSALQPHIDNPKEIQGIVGFDGFVDDIIDVVDKRQDSEHYNQFNTIADFAKRLAGAAGKSVNIELVSKKKKLGGNGPIMANSLSHLGLNVSYIGALGKPELHPVFIPMKEHMNVLSIAEPATTDALEFTDGKIMIGKLETLKNVSWETMQNSLGEDTLTNLFSSAKFMGFANWTMLPFMTEIWRAILKNKDKFKLSKEDNIFIDLADFEKRTEEDLKDAMNILHQFNTITKLTLGLNEKEALQLANLYNLKCKNPSKETYKLLAAELRAEIGIDAVCIHPRKFAVSATEEGTFIAEGPFITNPFISTGAGDHFNAGYFCGRLLGLSEKLSLYVGVLNSGYYVRTGISANLEQLRDFVISWQEGNI